MTSMESFTINEDATLLQAVEKIEENRSRAVVVLSGEKVVGMLSEGDIMRALLRNVDIHAPLDSMLVYSFKYLTERDMAQATSS